MVELLQNQWVVGICGGIVSGIIVFFITKWLFERKDNSKYLEQISAANVDIIRTLKPYIAEKGLPEKEIIDAIIFSTARKHKVKSEELYSLRIVCEELIREIIENVYVSTDKKREYSIQLKEYLHQLTIERDKSLLISDIQNEIKNLETSDKYEYKRKLTTAFSMAISIFTVILTFLTTFLLSDAFSVSSIQSYNIERFSIILLAPILAITLSFTLLATQKFIKKTKELNEKTKKN